MEEKKETREGRGKENLGNPKQITIERD